MNLHDKFKKRMENGAYEMGLRQAAPILRSMYPSLSRGEMAEIFGECYKSGYTQALTDVQGKVDELVEVLKECDYFCQDQKARANQAIATDCPDCDYQCVGCIHSIDDCDATSLKIRKALAKFKNESAQ